MTSQQKRQKPSKNKDSEPLEDVNLKGVETDSDIDDILDEIDSVLEANAEEFVRGFVQRGGE
jgi:ubiquitin-like protein Pup